MRQLYDNVISGTILGNQVNWVILGLDYQRKRKPRKKNGDQKMPGKDKASYREYMKGYMANKRSGLRGI